VSDGGVSLSACRPIAALFVTKGGTYYGLPDVDPWDEERDARLYAGPHPVVAHPPCARWSRLAGFVEHVHGYKRGEDGGCFEAALRAVRTYGGVLEHPAYSTAWDHFGLPKPKARAGWTLTFDGDASCYVEQGRYGELPVKKATWLYAYGVDDLPGLLWGYTRDGDGTLATGQDPARGRIHAWRDSWRPALQRGWRINEQRDGAIAAMTAEQGRMRGDRASHTPAAFRDVLIGIARTSSVTSEAAA
jgi:hypothetical protein